MTCWALLETFEGMPNGDFQDGQTAFQLFDLCLCAADSLSLFALRGERLTPSAAVSSGATREHIPASLQGNQCVALFSVH
jgi:hypothetical protein